MKRAMTTHGSRQPSSPILASAACIFLVFCSGCVAATRLPLCPKLAELSYPTLEEGRGQLLGRFVKVEAANRHVSVSPLSYFVAEFRGPRKEIKWLRRNYDILLTQFNPRLITEDEDVFTSAQHHVKSWMQLVDSGRYEDLMLEESAFCPVCCTNPRLMVKRR